MKMRKRTVWFALAAFVLTALLSAFVSFRMIKYKESEEREAAQYLSDMVMKNFSLEIDKYVQESELWKAAVINAGGEISRFEEIAASFADGDTAVASVQLAPEGIVTYLYPEVSAVNGYNILADPANITSVRIMLETKEPYVMGPFRMLSSDADALIVRNPVYLSEEGKPDEFWGFANVALELNAFLSETELHRLEEEGYSYTLSADGASEYEDIIADTNDTISSNPVVSSEASGGRNWSLSVWPKTGWYSERALGRYVFMCSLISLAAAAVTGLLVTGSSAKKSSLALEKELDETKESLAAAEKSGSFRMDFVKRACEEMLTPAGAIRNLSLFAKEDVENKEQVLNDIERIEQSNGYVLSLIQNISDVSLFEGGTVELNEEPYPFEDFEKYVTMILKENCEGRNQMFEVISQEGDDLPVVMCDRARLNEIVLNLVRNASSYTESGGKVVYRSLSRENEDGTVLCGFSIEDNGIGMSKEFQKRMFDQYARELENPLRPSEVPGTGIGLYIVRTLLDAMGGRIQVESEQGEGTKIFVTIPMKKAEQIDLHMHSASYLREREKAGSELRVLLAEDNEINREITVRIFEGLGLFTDEAVNGEEAVQRFKESVDGTYMAVFLDINMPVMDGYEAARAIRLLNRRDAHQVPLIALTGDESSTAKEKAAAAGMEYFINKPIDIANVTEVVENLRSAHTIYLSGGKEASE